MMLHKNAISMQNESVARMDSNTKPKTSLAGLLLDGSRENHFAKTLSTRMSTICERLEEILDAHLLLSKQFECHTHGGEPSLQIQRLKIENIILQVKSLNAWSTPAFLSQIKIHESIAQSSSCISCGNSLSKKSDFSSAYPKAASVNESEKSFAKLK